MARASIYRPDEVFILTEANGWRSREGITLKDDASAYESGTVVVAEYEESVAESGNFDTATGLYVRADATNLAAYDTVKAALICRRTVTDGADTSVAAIVRDAEVKSFELEVADGITLADIADQIAAQGIVIR